MICNGIDTKALHIFKDPVQKQVYQFLPEHDAGRNHGGYWIKKGEYIQELTEIIQKRIHRQSM